MVTIEFFSFFLLKVSGFIFLKPPFLFLFFDIILDFIINLQSKCMHHHIFKQSYNLRANITKSVIYNPLRTPVLFNNS